jgi:predicted phage terminase large subunit-like protein
MTASKAELAALERDLIALERARIRESFAAWCLYALSPLGLKPAAHHRLLIAKLQAVAEGKIKRLMVLMPPGSAKSTYASKLFPAWLLARRERTSIIGASHTASLAEDFSHDVQSLIRDNADMLGIELVNTSVDLWRTSNGGRYKSAGVDGPITGSRASAAIIDDPVKSRTDADSEAYRERAWKWFISDLRTRLMPGAPIVLVMTRWHEDDLGGRILAAQRDIWDIVRLPAIAEDGDPLGRAPGEVLGRDDPHYRLDSEIEAARVELEMASATREWSALYQQNPRPAEGSLFRIGNIGIVDAAPAGNAMARAWDLAATAKAGGRDPDWTAGVKLMRTAEGRFVVLDVARLRGGPEEVERTIVSTAAADGRAVRIGLPQDPGQAGKGQVQYLARQLAGHTVDASPETGDKVTRANPVASQVNVGNLSIVRAPWNRAFLDELAGFPHGAHDDQVDALSRAFAMIGMRPPPMRINPAAIAAFGRRTGGEPIGTLAGSSWRVG